MKKLLLLSILTLAGCDIFSSGTTPPPAIEPVITDPYLNYQDAGEPPIYLVQNGGNNDMERSPTLSGTVLSMEFNGCVVNVDVASHVQDPVRAQYWANRTYIVQYNSTILDCNKGFSCFPVEANVVIDPVNPANNKVVADFTCINPPAQ